MFGFWNNQISLVFAMLGQSPVSFKGGGPWAVIEGIEPVFVAVGSSLVVLFFVIGFCSESIDVKDEMRFESIFRMLIRLGLAEWFVANNVTIMKAFFTSIGNLVGLISACVLSIASCVVVPADISPTRFPMEVKNAFMIVTLFATNHSASPSRISILRIDSNLISSFTSMLSEQKPITKNSTTRDEPTATKTGSIPSITAQGPPPLKLTGDCPSIAKTRDI